MYHHIHCLGGAASAICGCRWQACALRVVHQAEQAQVRSGWEFSIPESHRIERKLICPSSNDSAHAVVRRDVSVVSGCWWESHKSITSHHALHALLALSYPFHLRSGEITSAYFSPRVTSILLLAPFGAIFCCSLRASHVKVNLLLGSLDFTLTILSNASRFGAFRLA